MSLLHHADVIQLMHSDVQQVQSPWIFLLHLLGFHHPVFMCVFGIGVLHQERIMVTPKNPVFRNFLFAK